MRLQLLAITAALAAATVLAGAPPPDDEFNASAAYDEVVRDLVRFLDKDRSSAKDAAVKLARLGKKALPVVAELLQANYGKEKGNAQVVFYCVYALSQMSTGDAARPLLPILCDDKAPNDLRMMSLQAIGLERSDEAVAAVQKIAVENADLQFRREAYSQLSVMPTAWLKSEKVFVDALADPDNDIRTLAAKQCYICRVYRTAVPALVTLAEKDPSEAVRINAMLALARMNIRPAVSMLVRLSQSEQSSAAIVQQATRTLQTITGVTMKDAAAVARWWTNFGEKEYGKLALPPPDAPKDAAKTSEEKTAESDLLEAQEVLQLLGISAEELQALVARGDLRAQRSGGKLKFRREDVVALKTKRPAPEPKP